MYGIYGMEPDNNSEHLVIMKRDQEGIKSLRQSEKPEARERATRNTSFIIQHNSNSHDCFALVMYD